MQHRKSQSAFLCWFDAARLPLVNPEYLQPNIYRHCRPPQTDRQTGSQPGAPQLYFPPAVRRMSVPFSTDFVHFPVLLASDSTAVVRSFAWRNTCAPQS